MQNKEIKGRGLKRSLRAGSSVHSEKDPETGQTMVWCASSCFYITLVLCRHRSVVEGQPGSQSWDNQRPESAPSEGSAWDSYKSRPFLYELHISQFYGNSVKKRRGELQIPHYFTG